MLKDTFFRLLNGYTADQEQIATLWSEIEQRYTEPGRHYHTLDHLSNLLEQLTAVKSKIRDWETVLFSLYYHDVVYDAQRPDNEEQSAELAEVRMRAIGIPEATIEACTAQILATKSHTVSENSDTNYFTDADLSILGQSWEIYRGYYRQIRQEYACYPDAVYNAGRKNVLEKFLLMEHLFKTVHFQQALERQARANIAQELTELTALLSGN